MQLTKEQYHHALSLYTIARIKQQEVVVLETEMNELLGTDLGSHASDAIYSMDACEGTYQREFNAAIKKMGIEKP